MFLCAQSTWESAGTTRTRTRTRTTTVYIEPELATPDTVVHNLDRPEEREDDNLVSCTYIDPYTFENVDCEFW